MKYFVTRVKFDRNGTMNKTEVFDYDSYLSAEAKVYTTVSTDMKDDNIVKSVSVIYDENGVIKLTKLFDRKQYDENEFKLATE